MKKKFCALLAAGLGMLSLSSCSQAGNQFIDKYDWQMTSIQAGDDGSAIACAPELTDIHGEAEPVRMTCQAKNGSLTITDSTHGISYTGQYSLQQENAREAVYTVSFEGAEGHGVTAMTTYHDGSQSPSFILSVDSYAINFEAQS